LKKGDEKMNIENDVKGKLRGIRQSGERVFFGDSQRNAPEAILAEVSGLVPVLGDVGDLFRTKQSYNKHGMGSEVGKRAFDAGIGFIPVVGDVADALYPKNLINTMNRAGYNVPEPPTPPMPGQKGAMDDMPDPVGGLRSKGWLLPPSPKEVIRG